MADVRHYRNGKLVDGVVDFQGIKVTCVWDSKHDGASISLSNLEIKGNDAAALRDRIFGGLSGNIGVFEGEPWRIETGQQGAPAFTFEGYLDFTDGLVIRSCDHIAVSLKKRKGGDWLTDKADGISMAAMFDAGEFGSDKFYKIPYIINYVPDGFVLAFLSLAIFQMTKEFIENAKEIAFGIAEVINAATPSVGVGVVVDVGDIIWSILLIVARIIYAIFILISIKKMAEELFEQLLPKMRTHLGMSLYTMFDLYCKHFDLVLQSSLLTAIKDWVMLPPKDYIGGKPPKGVVEMGCPRGGDPLYTFGDAIRTCSEMLNADFRVANGKFIFERIDQFETESDYKLVETVEADTLQDPFTLNTDEFRSHHVLAFDFDTQDQNTLDDQTGRVFGAYTSANVVSEKDLSLMKGLNEDRYAFALGKRKEDFTKIESVLKELARAIDKITGVFGGGTNYASKIEGRLNKLLMSSHNPSKPKLIKMSGQNVAADNRDVISAKALWFNYHYINSFVEINGRHNQWIKRAGKKVPMCEEDFNDLQEANMFTLANGKRARVDKLEWTSFGDVALIDYRLNEQYDKNLKIQYYE